MVSRLFNKKGVQRYLGVGLITWLIAGSFLFSQKAEALTDPMIYQKAVNGTLSATEWNNLLNDFVAYRDGGKVGIGTATPISKLDVIGSIKGNQFNIHNGSAYIGGIGYEGGLLAFKGGSSLITRMAMTWNGNVGIGTTAPNDALSIGNAGSSAPAGSSNTGHNFTQTYLNSDKYALANYGLVETLVANATSSLASAIGFWNANGANIYNINTGNVGIGTTGPSEKLDINGNLRLFDSGGAAGDSMTIDPRALGSGIYVKTISMGADVNGRRSSLNIINNGANTSNINHIGAFNSPSLSVWSQNMDKAIRFLANGVAEIQTYNNGDLYLNTGSGNVGIGTTNPRAKLEIPGGWASTLLSGDNVVVRKPNYAGGGWARNLMQFEEYDGTVLTSLGMLGSDNKVSYGYLGISYNSTAMRWYPDNHVYFNNNVGIGTMAPNDALSIGNAGSSAPAGSSNTGHNFTQTYLNSDKYALANYGLVETLVANATSSLASAIGFWNASGTNIYNINTGNVGIGTTNPTALLEVGADNNSSLGLIVHGGSGGSGSTLADFRMYGGTSVFRIAGDGALHLGGVATISGLKKLTISDAAPGGILEIRNTTAGSIASPGETTINFTGPAGTKRAAIVGLDKSQNISGGWLKFQTIDTSSILQDRMIIDRYGNVGIGTTNPNDTLSISDSAGNSSPAGAARTGHNYTSTYISADKYALANYGLVESMVNNSSFWSLNGTHIYNNNSGNVGIGTTNPGAYKLYVSHTGSSGVVGTMRFANSNNDYTSLSVLSNGVGFNMSAHSTGIGYINANSSLNFTSNNGSNGATLWMGNGARMRLVSTDGLTNYFTINTAGNVGIGTTNPNARLHLVDADGTNIILGNYAALGTTYSSWGTVLGNNVKADEGTTGQLTYMMSHPSMAGAAIFLQGNVITFHAKSGASTAGAAFNSPRMTITGDGNVGIGTTAPNDSLSIGNAGSAAPAGSANTGHNFTQTYLSTDKYALANYGLVETLVANATSSLASAIGFWNASGTNIYNINTGNVGIGTTVPNEKFSVNGNASISGTLTVSGYKGINAIGGQPNIVQRLQRASGGYAYSIFEGYADNTDTGLSSKILDYGAYGSLQSGSIAPTITYAYFGVGTSSSYTNTHIRLYDNANKVVSFDGNVGIGTTNPNDTLSISDSAGNSSPAGAARTGHNYTSTYISADKYALANYGLVESMVNNSSFWSLNGTHIYNNNSGNVGIGTTNPGQKLAVKASGSYVAEFLGSGASIVNIGSSSLGGESDIKFINSLGEFWMGIDNTGLAMLSSTAGAIGMKFNTAGTERMRITNLGNVGIGTNNPGYKLQVEGAGYFNGSLTGSLYSATDTTYPLIARNTTNTSAAGGNVGLKFALSTESEPNKWVSIESFDTSNWGSNGGLSFTTMSGYTKTKSMVILSSGNVGIGTTAPNDALSIGNAGSSAPAGSARTGHNYTSTYLSADSYALVNYGLLKTMLESPTGQVGYWTLSGTNIYNNNTGNIAVGTTTPSAKFTINNTAAFSVSSLSTARDARNAFRIRGRDTATSTLMIGSVGINDYAIQNVDDAGTGANNIFINPFGGNVAVGRINPNVKLDVAGSIARGTRLGANLKQVVGVDTDGQNLMIIDPSWSNEDLQAYFACNNVDWYNDPTAPGGYAIRISNSSCYVAPSYASGVPLIPVDDDDVFYVEAWVKHNDPTARRFYFGSYGYNSALGGLGGNNYWTNPIVPTDTWTKISAYKAASTLPAGTKYISPLALLFYSGGAGYEGYVSGWKVIKVNSEGNRYFADKVGIGSTTTPSDIFSIANGGAYAPNGSANTGHNFTQTYLSTDKYALANYGLVETLVANATSSLASAIGFWSASGSNIYNSNAGNVGIGTNSPTQKLDVNGIISASKGFLVNNALAATGQYLRGNGSFFTASTIQASDIPVLNQNTTGSAYYLVSRDTRTTADVPQDYNALVKFDFKGNSTSGLSDGGSFSGVMTWRKYGNGTDMSGGPALQLAYSDRGNLWTRLSSSATTWDSWRRVISEHANGNVGIGSTASTPNDALSIASGGAYAPTGSSGTGHNYTQTYLSTDKYALANYGLVEALIDAKVPPIVGPMLPSSSPWTTSGTNIYNNNTGNVGIGTASPAAKLDVAGEITLGTIPNGRPILSQYYSSPYTGLKYDAPGGVSGWYGVHDFYTGFNGATSTLAMRIVNGNVGIGTTSPRSKLEVAGDILIPNGNSLLSRDAGNNVSVPLFKFDSSNALSIGTWEGSYVGNTYIKGGNGDVYADFSAGNNRNFIVRKVSGSTPTELMRVTAAGNVGIGTTAPNDALSIGNAGSSAPAGSSNTGHNFTQTYLNSDKYALANYGLVETLINTMVPPIISPIIASSSLWGANGNHIFNTNTGNVGIGTTSPVVGSKLQIIGEQGSQSGNSFSGVLDLYNTTTGVSGENIGPYISFSGKRGAAVDVRVPYGAIGAVNTENSETSGGALVFLTKPGVGAAQNLTEQMRITVGGRVGIGVTSPVHKLELVASTTAAGGIGFGTDTELYRSAANTLALASGDSLNLVSGNLQVAGTNVITSSRLILGSNGTVSAPTFSFSADTNTGMYSGGADILRFSTAGANRMTILANGSVGIGTTAPNDALSIGNAGSSAPAGSSNTGHNFTQTYLNSDKYALANYGLVETLVANATSSLASAIGFWNASGANIYNINAGNVGIGTTAPGSMLDVNGLIKMRTSTITYPEDVVNKGYVDSAIGTATSTISGAYLPLAGGTMNASAAINMNSGSITNLNQLTVSKITANTIDPLYRIKGINYSTFAAAIVGGVKEEYVGQAKISQRNTSGEYEYVVDFAKEQEGSDLWVWHKTVDYKDDKVQVFITPTRSFAQTYYIVEGDRLILRADKPVSVSYRLIGNRFDWRSWPTLSDDQESTGLIVP